MKKGDVAAPAVGQQNPVPFPIRFKLKSLPFRLESDESLARNAPETMADQILDANEVARK